MSENKLVNAMFKAIEPFKSVLFVDYLQPELKGLLETAKKAVYFGKTDEKCDVIVLSESINGAKNYESVLKKYLDPSLGAKKVLVAVPVERSFGCGKINFFTENSFDFLKNPLKIEKIAPTSKHSELKNYVFLVEIDVIPEKKSYYKPKYKKKETKIEENGGKDELDF